MTYVKGDNKTHGMRGSKIYSVWTGIKTRCYNQNDHNYLRYGARGIKMCDSWKGSFESFYEDVGDIPEKPETEKKPMSLDRIDNEGDYSPENCEWSTWSDQCNNRRSNVLLTRDGKIMNVLQWAKELSMDAKLIYSRKSKGWSDERTLTEAVGFYHRNK